MAAHSLLAAVGPSPCSQGEVGRGWNVEARASFHPTPARPAVAHGAPALINPRADGSQAGFFAPCEQGREPDYFGDRIEGVRVIEEFEVRE